MTDIYITGNTYSINCKTSSWNIQDYSITFETWMNKSNLNILRDNITPGAVSELYQVLGRPFYYDKTWTGENTLRILPIPSTNSTIRFKRKEMLVYVKNISDSPIEEHSGWINCKIDGYISGGQY